MKDDILRNTDKHLWFLCFPLTYSWVKSMRFCRSMSSRYARMLLLMNRLSWSLIQSLKTKASTPVVSSRKKMIPRNTENCGRRADKSDELLGWSQRQHARSHRATYKLQQERVFTQRSDASCEAQDEHHPSNHHEEPDWVQTAQVCDGRDVGQDSLRRQKVRHKAFSLNHTIIIFTAQHTTTLFRIHAETIVYLLDLEHYGFDCCSIIATDWWSSFIAQKHLIIQYLCGYYIMTTWLQPLTFSLQAHRLIPTRAMPRSCKTHIYNTYYCPIHLD